jgi:hypothetical protein
MRNQKRNFSIASTAAAVSVLMAGGMAIAQDVPATDPDYKTATNKAYDASSTMDHMKDKVDGIKKEASQMSSNFGVEELNDIEDWEIVNNGEDLGSIDRLGVDRSTGEILAIVGLEGVVGANMKEVAVPLKKLQKAGDESLSTNMTKEQLQTKRDIDPWDDTYADLDDAKASY